MRGLGVTATLVVLSLAVAACGKPPQPSVNEAQQRAQARSVTVVKVEAREITGGLAASGTLVPREDTAIFSDINGYRVARVMADEGQWVQTGQMLAVLDDTLILSQIDQQTALVSQQAVNAARAEAEAQRVDGLDGEGVLSREQVEARRFAATSARAQLAAQQASLKDLRTRHLRMVVRAPYAGLVIERNVRQGDQAGSTTPWFRIARAGQIELQADVAESALSHIAPGMTAQVTLADGTKVEGVVRIVSPRVDTQTKLGRVRISLPVQPNIRSGGFASAAFQGGGHSAPSVPESAIRYDANGASVMTVASNGKVARVGVTTGQRGNGFVELTSGPPVGTVIVARAAAMLVNGDFVKPVTAPAQARPATAAAAPAAPRAAPAAK